jgi:hypothetical protein
MSFLNFNKLFFVLNLKIVKKYTAEAAIPFGSGSATLVKLKARSVKLATKGGKKVGKFLFIYCNM